MINISAEAKSKYVKDSVEKEIVIGYCHKDYVEIANINMGTPAGAYMYDGNITMIRTTSLTQASPWLYVWTHSGNYYGVVDVDTPLKNLHVEFEVSMPDLQSQYYSSDPKWLFTYIDGFGQETWYYIPTTVENLALYKNATQQNPQKVKLDIPLEKGISHFYAISLLPYTNAVLDHSEQISIKGIRFMYSKANDINIMNMVLLKDIPDYDFSDYQMHYITKDNLEEESFSITESLSSKDNLKYGLCEASVCEFTVVNYDDIKVGDIIYPKCYIDGVEDSTVPYGEYVVQSIQVSYEGSLKKKRITAYGKITNLENKAYNWNSIYMYGINTYTDDGAYTGRGFEFARQIYSSVFSALEFFGIEDIRKHELELIHEISGSSAVDNTRWLPYDISAEHWRVQYVSYTISNPDTDARYMVENDVSDDTSLAINLPQYTTRVDALYRGVKKADILVEEYWGASNYYHRTLVDSGDLFAISKSCTNLKIYIPFKSQDKNNSGTVIYQGTISSGARIYKESGYMKLTNKAERLMYYNYFTKEIFPINSEATGRDVVRSMLEVCGCFFGLDRKYGMPEFKYPKKSGLYPSNTLFPSDTLFPRSGVNAYLEMNRYETLRAEDYSVLSYGKIQIVKQENSNDVASCVWEHEGSNAKNTYIIDDNIYYCSDEMEYDYDLMIDVSRVLSNMFLEITNNNYTPFKATLIGLPWIECGDRIDFRTHNGNFETFIYRRKIKGIDLLKDTYEAKGDMLTEGVNTYLYTQEE